MSLASHAARAPVGQVLPLSVCSLVVAAVQEASGPEVGTVVC